MNFRILLILGSLSAFGPMAIDFYLPSFPALALAFHRRRARAAEPGVLLHRPGHRATALRADRRPLRPAPAAAGGVSLFTLASVACAMAPSLEWLIGARFVQALGGCAGMVVSRAVVRDLCDPITSAKVFSQLMLVMGLAPILAPLGGGLLLDLFGWPSIFYGLTLFSALVLTGVYLWLPETLTTGDERPPLRGALGQYKRLLGTGVHRLRPDRRPVDGRHVRHIAGSPFVFIELYGVPAEHYGWLFGGNALGFILVAQVNAWLMRFGGPAYWMRRVVWFYLGAHWRCWRWPTRIPRRCGHCWCRCSAASPAWASSSPTPRPARWPARAAMPAVRRR